MNIANLFHGALRRWRSSRWFFSGLMLGLLALHGRAADCPPTRSTRFDGSPGSGLEFKHRAGFDASVPMTVEAWVFRSNANNCETILSHSYSQSWWFGFCERLRFYRSGGAFADADQTIPAGQWCHVAASYDGKAVSFYINGQPAGTRALAHNGANFTGPVIVGGDPGGYVFSGALDEIRLWSTARTGAEIAAGMETELRNQPKLEAVWDTGGRREVVSNISVPLGLRNIEQAAGVLPRDLLVPRTTVPIAFDGTPALATEYAGAEQVALRRHSQSLAPDVTAHLVYRDAAVDRALYIGITGLAEPTGTGRAASYVAVQLDAQHAKRALAGSVDLQLRAYLDGSLRTFVGDGKGGFVEAPNLANLWEARFSQACAGNGPPCLEIRIPESTLGSLITTDGIAIAHVGLLKPDDVASGPIGVVLPSPKTWASVTYCEALGGPTQVTLSGVVTRSGQPMANVAVALDGPSKRLTLTDSKGQYAFGGLIPGSYRVAPHLDGFGFQPAIGEAKGLNANRTLSFAGFSTQGPKPLVSANKPSGTRLELDRRIYPTGDGIHGVLTVVHISTATELHALVASTITGDVELMTLKRDPLSPRTFRSQSPVVTTNAPSSPHDGVLSVKPGDRVAALFYVQEDPSHPPTEEESVGDFALIRDPDFAGSPVVLKPEIALTPDELQPPEGAKRLGTLIARGGWPLQIPIDELVFFPRDADDLKRFLEATGGQVLATQGDIQSGESPSYLVRVAPPKADLPSLRQIRDLMEQKDEVVASNSEVLDLWSTILDLRLRGYIVASNPRLQFHDVPGPLPVETDEAPGSRTLLNNGPLNVPQLWAFLALWDRDEMRIPTGILDVGFAPSPDLRTPLVECDMEAAGPGGMLCGPGRAFGVQRVGNSLFGSRTWHGTGVATTLAGKLNNRWSPGDGRIGGRAGVAGQIAQPMLYQYGLGSYVFEFGAGIQKAAADGASVINLSGGYPCRIADNLGIGFNICSPAGRAALCATATVILATASAAICATAGATAAIPFVGPIIAIPLFIACGVATAATVAASTACFATLLIGDPRDPMIAGVQFATERGVPIVVSAGNRLSAEVLPPVIRDLINFNEVRIEEWQVFPAMIEPCIVAGATSDNWPFDNQHFTGNRVNIWAPIRTAYYRPLPEDRITPANEWGLETIGGTSAAAPYAAGTIAAMQAVNPSLNPRTPGLTAVQRRGIPARIRGILTNSAWTTAELAAMAPPDQVAAVNAGAPLRRHLINPLRAVRTAAAGIIPDFAPLGYDTRMNFNEINLAEAADDRDNARPLGIGTVETGTLINILGEDGAPDRADVDWWRIILPTDPSGLHTARIQLTYPRGFGDLTLEGLSPTTVETIGAETRITFVTPALFARSDLRFAVRGVGRADNVYKLAWLDTAYAGAAPPTDRFDRNTPGNPSRPDNNAVERATPVGNGTTNPWVTAASSFGESSSEIVVRELTLHSGEDVDWFRIENFPELEGCQPSLQIEFGAGMQCTVWGRTRRSASEVIARSTVSPLTIPYSTLPLPPVRVEFSNVNPLRPVIYTARFVYRTLPPNICALSDLQRERGASSGRDIFSGGRFPFPCPAPDSLTINPDDFLQLPGRRGDNFGRVLTPEWNLFEWRGGGDFAAQFDIPAKASLRVRLLNLDGHVLAETATPELLGQQSGPPDAFAGARTISLRRPSLAPGTYILEYSEGTLGILIGLNLPRNAIRDGSPGIEDLAGGPLAPPPALLAAPGNDPFKEMLSLSWPSTEQLPRLEESDALRDGIHWSASRIPVRAGKDGFNASIPPGEDTRFFRLHSDPERCLDIGTFEAGPRSNPWTVGGYQFDSDSTPGGTARPNVLVRALDGTLGVDVDTFLTVGLPVPAHAVDLEFVSRSGWVEFTAYDAAGIPVATERVLGTSPMRRRVVLRSATTDIAWLSVQSPNALTVIAKLCCEFTDLLGAGGLGDDCRDFRLETPRSVPNPLESDGLKFQSWLRSDSAPIPDPNTRIEDVGGHVGYHVQYRTEIELMRPCAAVAIDFLQRSGLVEFEAFDADGVTVDRRTVLGVTGAPQSVHLGRAGAAIRRVVVIAPNDLTTLLRVCCEGSSAVAGTGTECANYRVGPGAKPNPWTAGNTVITRRLPSGLLAPSVEIITHNGEQGIAFGGGETDILLPAAVRAVQLKVAMEGDRLEIQALDAGFRIVDSQILTGPGPRLDSVTLRGSGIVRVRVESPGAKGVVAELCQP